MAWDQITTAAGIWSSLNELSTVNQPDFDWNTLTPINLQKNEALCIDPRFIAVQASLNNGLPANCRTFPYQEPFTDANGDGICQSSEFTASLHDLNGNGFHDPLQIATTFSANQFAVNGVPNPRQFDTSLMRRVTLWSGQYTPTGLKAPMTLAQANTIFRVDDDLAYQRDTKDKSKPATQDTLLIPGTGTTASTPSQWFKRDTERNISWIATLVPLLNVSGVQSDQYVLSIVMIHQRTLEPVAFVNNSGQAGTKMYERTVVGAVQGDGASGGEFTLIANDPDQLKVRPNMWVMLSGVLPNYPTVGRFHWYRVTECDPEPFLNGGLYGLNCSLVGQDWNTSLLAPSPPNGALASGFARVTIVEGAYAVYEKTIRMEPDSTF
jgi:hypothetical protein